MKQQLNYGFPLFSVLIRVLSTISLILFIAMLISIQTHINLYVILSVGILIVFLYAVLGIIFYKKSFLTKRKNILKEMINLAELNGNETILDLGTGSGFIAIGFAKKIKNGMVYGVDRYSIKYDNLKSRLINLAKINFIGISLKNAKTNAIVEKVNNKCEFVEHDLTKPSKFPDSNFDIILSSQFIYCLPTKKRQQVFQEINRVLKKNGKIIFFESKGFLKWDINIVKNYFEKIGYKIDIKKVKEFKGNCILSGTK